MRYFQCSKKHRWSAGMADYCSSCSKQSEDLVLKKPDEMCPCCGRHGGLWGGVNSTNYCDYCGFEWDVNLSKIDRLQKILDFKKETRCHF